MILPNPAFDALMFGLLLLAAALDSALPILHGVASLLIVGGATYWAAQELGDLLLRRIGWTQESLATSVALCAGGFLYFALRNSSDLALLVLSIGLMMGALMAAISILAAVHAAFKDGRATPLVGWVVTTVASLALGVTAGLTAIVLGLASSALLPLKICGIVGAFVLWKVRENLAPPAVNPHFQEVAAQSAAPVPSPLATLRVALFPQRGTLLDRLFPLLLTGILLLALVRNGAQLALPSSPAVAASENGEAR